MAIRNSTMIGTNYEVLRSLWSILIVFILIFFTNHAFAQDKRSLILVNAKTGDLDWIHLNDRVKIWLSDGSKVKGGIVSITEDSIAVLSLLNKSSQVSKQDLKVIRVNEELLPIGVIIKFQGALLFPIGLAGGVQTLVSTSCWPCSIAVFGGAALLGTGLVKLGNTLAFTTYKINRKWTLQE